MKNLLNLKGLCRSSQLALNSDGQTTVERRSNDGHIRRHLPVGLTKRLSLFLLLTLGVGQMWGGMRRIYFDKSNVNWWNNDSHKSCVYAWDNNGSTKYEMTNITSTNIYYADINDAYNKIIFYRSTSKDGSWTNQSVDITIDGYKNYFKLKNEDDNGKKKLEFQSFYIQSAYFYFDKSKCTSWGTGGEYIMITIGRYNKTVPYAMTNISNTYLYYKQISGWVDYDRYRFLSASTYSEHDSQMADNPSPITKYTAITSGSTNSAVAINNGTYNLYTFNGTSGTATTKSEKAAYTGLNYTQTVESWVKTGSNAYDKADSKSNITTSSYVLNSATSSTASTNPTLTTSANTVTFSAAHSANTTLTAATPAAGYEFVGWYNTSGAKLSASLSYNYRPRGATTIRAYYAQTHSITFNTGINGTVSPTGVQSVGQKGVTITASSPAAGYYFAGWTCTGGASVASSTSTTTTVTATGTGNVTANFAPRYVLRGSKKNNTSATGGMPGDNVNIANMDVVAATSTKTLTLEPNTEYQYKIRDLSQDPGVHGQTSSGTQGLGSGNQWTLNGANYVYFKTKGYGSYTFNVGAGANPTVWISDLTSHQITMGQQTKTDGSGSVGTGGTVSAKTTENAVDYTISSGEYVRDGGTVTFTATPNTGYQFIGWYSAATTNDGGASPVSTANPYTISSITSAQTVYALFKETLYDVTVNDGNTTTTKQVGVVSHPSITAVSPTGKVFKRWDISGSATLDDEYSKTTTITGVTHHGVTITATFQDPPTLYYVIDHVSSWSPSTMYVYFYENNYWNKDAGSGSSGTGFLKKAAMTPVEGKNKKWWKYTFNPETEDGLAGHSIYRVSFMEKDQNVPNFNDNNTGTSREYQSCMNMFIVCTTGGTNHLNSNTCWYYNDGYWYNYKGEKSGYYLHNLGDDVEFIADENGVYTASVNLEAGDRYFYIGGCDSKNWAHNEVFDANNRSHQLSIYNDLNEKAHLKANVGGIYKFKLTPVFSGFTNDEAKMQLEIEFPVSAGEYRAVYNNAASSPTESRPSNSIKGDQSSGTVSLWLNAGNNYITFEASAVDGSTGALTWSTVGSQQTVTGIAAAGVYTMTLTKDGSTYGVSNIQPYTGSYYIRTDCAPGKWKEYTSNALAQNKLTYKAGDATTYDYYLCKYAANNTNVRCVIANDYNLAVSDTLKDDEILNHDRVGTYETLPAATNVRFSWNSSTNTLKRAYLLGSTEADNYLNINPIEASKIYKTDGTTDLHGTTAANRKFTDLNNWVYMLEIMAVPNGTASITATYNGDEQVLLAATKMIGSTNESTSKYTINIIYDYKLNNLITAWKPNPAEEITDQLKDVDMLWVRNAQSAADGLRLGLSGSLENVTVMGAIRLNYNDFNQSYMSSWNESSRPKLMHFISFPFPVNVSDIFGLNDATYGREYVIKKYDSERRALQGAFEEDDHNFWKDLTTEEVMEANRGYCLVFDNDIRVGGPMGSKIWENKGTGDFVYLYFPTKTVIGSITNANCTTTVAAHPCAITREFIRNGKTYTHDKTDSHWNLIGMPMFNTAYVNNYNTIVNGGDTAFNSFYQWNSGDNTWSVRTTAGTPFQPMHSYMVQRYGDVIWSITNPVPAGIAARKTIASKKSYTLKLELWQNGASEASDWAFVEMREGANKDFVLCEDLFKIENTNRHNIVVYAGNYDVAYSQVPVENQTIPVGVIIRQNGTYTFSMPSNFDGTVTLIDKFAQTRTNLALGDYEVALERGTINDRFELEINIRNVPTAIDGVTDGSGSLKDGKAHKFIENGAMYILREGQIYDARGNKIK